jgi:hypothetical protein
METRDYCRARSRFAYEISFLNHHYEVRSLYEIVLDHQLDLLRLCASDNQGIRDEFCFTLISLNLDKEAYNFVKWWAVGEYEKRGTMLDRHLWESGCN